MVQISLLPIAEKKKGKRKAELKIKLKPLIFFLSAELLAIIAVWAMLGIRLAAQEKQLIQLDGQLKSSKFSLQKLDKLKEDKKQLIHKLEFMDRYLKREVLWAQNLNRLSNLVLPGIWLKNVVLRIKKEDHLHKYEKLNINGSSVSIQHEEMIDLIGGFMAALKNDQVFSEQFSEIKLISSQRRQTRVGKIEVEVMDFKLLCNFNEKIRERK